MTNPDNISVGTTIYFCFEDGSPGKGIIAGSGIDNWERPCYKVRVYKPHHQSGVRLRYIPKGRVLMGRTAHLDVHWADIKVGWRVRASIIWYVLTHRFLNESGLLLPLWLQYWREHN